MTADIDSDLAGTVPRDYLAIPIIPGEAQAPLRICALVKRQAEPMAGHLVVLRDVMDGQVLLGCVTDAGGRVQQWVELWVQNLDGLARSIPACRSALTNAILDARWRERFLAMQGLDQSGVLTIGLEEKHPAPTLLDLAELCAVQPLDPASAEPWALCRDEALLAKAGLPPYGTSLHRYLYLPGLGEKSPFAPVTPEAPTTPATRPLKDALGDEKLLPLNGGGGLMMVRAYSPIGLEALLDVLGGGEWRGLTHGRSPLDPDGSARRIQAEDPTLPADGRLFLGAHGEAGRYVEGFHLKLRLLFDAFQAVRTFQAQTQLPLLNLRSESFQVRLPAPAPHLPFLWMARAVLVDAGDAIALPIQTAEARYFLRPGGDQPSVYQPAAAGGPIQGRSAVRIRQVFPQTGGATVLEGTFTTQERIAPATNDLLWLRLNLSSGRCDLYAHLESHSALAGGEWRFRTVPQQLGERAVAALRAAEGVPIPDAPFELVPLLSSPCDLYALGVLAVRALLVNKQTTLPKALDELFSLSRQLALEENPAESLADRIRDLFGRDARYLESLGPQRLSAEPMPAEKALDLLPSELWWETLAMVVAMFPGAGTFSQCRDFGDAQPGGIHKVFDRALGELDGLLLRTRSLIVMDWRFNREIHSVLRKHLVGITGGGKGE